jgi:hypothetical protein
MTRFQDHLGDPAYSRAIRTKLGDALREQYDLLEPVPPSLVELLARLSASVRFRETTEAKLYAEIDECVAALVQAANRKPRETEELVRTTRECTFDEAPLVPGAFAKK